MSRFALAALSAAVEALAASIFLRQCRKMHKIDGSGNHMVYGYLAVAFLATSPGMFSHQISLLPTTTAAAASAGAAGAVEEGPAGTSSSSATTALERFSAVLRTAVSGFQAARGAAARQALADASASAKQAAAFYQQGLYEVQAIDTLRLAQIRTDQDQKYASIQAGRKLLQAEQQARNYQMAGNTLLRNMERTNAAVRAQVDYEEARAIRKSPSVTDRVFFWRKDKPEDAASAATDNATGDQPVTIERTEGGPRIRLPGT
jgi:hypothetical protein